tara:strand:+ start:269 stop:760 length:492 start_codon:yes stop_codon:yes gene_type:complete
MLKRNFILLSLVGLVIVILTTFEDKNIDIEALPSNENIDLSNVFENLDTNIGITSEEYIVVNLWATWCTPCIEEVGYLQKLNDLDEFIVVGLLVDDSETNAIEFIKEYNLTYKNILSEEKVESVISQFFWSGLPTTLLLSKNFIVINTFNGPITDEMIIDYIN